MTFDPKHDYEDEASAKARFNGSLQQPGPCPCHLCRMFDLTDGPILVPAFQHLPDGSRRFTGRWLHGMDLKRQMAARRQYTEGLKQALSGHVMVER
jgi:hypothetical protein